LKDTQRETCLVKWFCTPAKQPTTSEPAAGNSRTGAPVKAPSNWHTNQQEQMAGNFTAGCILKTAEILCVFQGIQNG